MTIRNNYVFKGHKTLLGSRYVTYGEVELPLKYELFPKSKDGFDWGHNGAASTQLAFSMLHQLSNSEFASQYASEFSTEVVQFFNSRDWLLNAADVVEWIEKKSPNAQNTLTQQTAANIIKSPRKLKKIKRNVVKDVCQELSITQKNLAEILEVPEGTVSSWAVKNEIPRLGKKAIEFYILNRKNQDVVDSYKNFIKLLSAS
jgi:DNA-binding transcriptional regulator YiaG